MKYLSLYSCILLCLFINEIQGAAYYLANKEDPDNPGFCGFKDDTIKIPLLLKPGETKKHPYKCYQITCSENFSLYVVGCGIAQGTKECPFVEGLKTDPYPKCCGEIQCLT